VYVSIRGKIQDVDSPRFRQLAAAGEWIQQSGRHGLSGLIPEAIDTGQYTTVAENLDGNLLLKELN
jgi:hypothetical protein